MSLRARRYQAGSRQFLAQALVAICAAGATYAWSLNFTPLPSARRLAAPEAMMVRALLDVRERNFSAALEKIDHLIASNPNFRLAQLVKGDLLLSRVKPIHTIGNAAGSADEQTGLRDEARARMARYHIEPPGELAPRYLLKLPASEKHALVLDSTRSTLFVFENDGESLRYLADYYVTIGKNGLEKIRTGDKRTPTGVYHIVSRLPREKLTDFYGSGAYPIDYPNQWDKMRGRSGYGIWLHGTPRDTYSRPPRASDGCIVLTNEDLDSLSKILRVGGTPVVITDTMDWATPQEVRSLRGELVSAIENWRRDWESRDTTAYLRHYAGSFTSGEANLAQWSAQKHQVNAAKHWIKVGISQMSLTLYPAQENMAVATFEQDYASSNLSNRMMKRQYWIKENGHWRILYEGAA